jgi:quercetin dioxygenase-like cupin family protein
MGVKSDTPYGPIGTRILFENEYTRVWEVVLEPGERQRLHHHELPYLVIPIEGGRGRITAEDGSVRLTDEHPGDVVFQPGGQIHELENIGETRYRNRLVEFKR